MNFIFKLAVISLISASSFAGTGAGGGDRGDWDRRNELLSREMQSGNIRPSEYLYEWCGNTSKVLKAELRRSRVLLSKGNLSAAKNTLVSALRLAGNSFSDKVITVKPMTKKLIDRGVRYLNVIDKLEWGGPERLKLVSQLNFLMEYVQLIVDTESSLDRPYHIPYHYEYDQCRRGCSQFNVGAYEAAFVNQMRAELNFVVNTLTTSGGHNGVIPLGSPEIFLKVSEILSYGVAVDLSENLYAYQNSCAVVDLESMSDVLKDYNWYNDSGYFLSELHAVTETASELRRVAGILYPQENGHSRRGCNTRSEYGYSGNSSSEHGYSGRRR